LKKVKKLVNKFIAKVPPTVSDQHGSMRTSSIFASVFGSEDDDTEADKPEHSSKNLKDHPLRT
jgi:hypothetical protein